jgi:predicted cobalt transporter CbtA
VNWSHVLVAAAAAFAISMIFYSLPVMRTQRKAQALTNASHREPETGSETLLSAVMTRLVNTFLYAFMLAWFLQLTGISSLGMGLLFVLVAVGRAALAPQGLNPHLINPPRAARLVDNLRFILVYLVMTGILMFWR